MLRPFIVKVSVLGYFPLHKQITIPNYNIYIYIYIDSYLIGYDCLLTDLEESMGGSCVICL